MGRWFRVFAGEEGIPEPAAILDHLQAQQVEVSGEFEQGAGTWYAAELIIAPIGTQVSWERQQRQIADAADTIVTPIGAVRLERFHADEEGLRSELNSWAAWLETCESNPLHAALMERIIQTRELVTLDRMVPSRNTDMMDRLCVGLCLFLARATDGIWQADGEGLFAADGTLLVAEQ
jgi:hypothetical protein